MQQRRVTDPQGTRWIVGRRWLLGRPRYLGFRFGVTRRPPEFEPAVRPETRPKLVRRPDPTPHPTPPPVYYRKESRRRSGGGNWGAGRLGGFFGRGSGGIETGGGSGRATGGGSRVAGRARAGGSRGRSKGGGSRGGGGAEAAGGLLAALAKFLKYVLIALAVIAAILFVIFVLGPAVLWALQYLAYFLVVGATILLRLLTGRPWIVELEEADGFRVTAWRIKGWRQSKLLIDEVAESVRRGEEPTATAAEPVEVVNG